LTKKTVREEEAILGCYYLTVVIEFLANALFSLLPQIIWGAVGPVNLENIVPRLHYRAYSFVFTTEVFILEL
jgi:hypothetical protein